MILSIGSSGFTKSKSKSKNRVAVFELVNLTKKKELNFIQKLFKQRLIKKLKQDRSIRVISKIKLPNPTIQAISKKYPKLTYAVYGSYKMAQKNVIMVEVTVLDLKYKKKLDSIQFYHPLNSMDFSQLQRVIENIFWAITSVPFQVFTEPKGSEVYVNKKYIGRTPLKRLRGKAGSYNILIYKKGFQKLKDKIVLKKGKENTFFFPLKAESIIEAKSKINIKYAYPFINDDQIEVDPFFPILLSFEYFIYGFSFELETGIINLEKSTGVTNEFMTISLFPVTLTAKYHFLKNEVISPYLGFGGGVSFVNVAESSSGQTNAMFYVIVGFNFLYIPISGRSSGIEYSSRIGFFVEARYFNSGNITISGRDIKLEGFMCIAGISYVFF